MQLLLSRDQKAGSLSLVPLRIGAGVTFTLHATLQLEPEEDALLKKYALTTVPLIISSPIEDFRNALRSALIVGAFVWLLMWILIGWWAAIPMAVAVTIIMTVVYFFALREQLQVNHLMVGGRTFYCFSVRELIEKEAYLEGTCSYLRQLLESAKHWGDREAIDIPPLDREAAKQAVLNAK
ncbi:MAG: hypothetical protein AAFQ10_03865 [Pseudomonadota bacterium]